MNTKYQPGSRVSEYLLEECLGGGTFGEVWRARHHVWDTERVAIKLPTEPEYVRYLQREGVVVHGLRHANIVRVVGLDPYAEPPYMVMELVNGPSLRDVLNANPHGLPIDQAVVVIRGVLSAMDAAHAAGIVHRDLKPGNVLLHLEGQAFDTLTVDRVKVADFGLGVENADALRSMVAQSASIQRDDESAVLAGTLAYMAPELRDRGEKPTPQSDLYAIGVMLFEVLTGERPAGAEVPSAVRAEVPAGIDDVFRRLYARKDTRYESAAAVLADLDKALQPTTVPPPVPTGGGAVDGRCTSCKAAVDPEDQFCTNCGVQLVGVVRRCPSCKGYPGRRDRYCIFCGAALTAIEE